jgi:hypothetical protein
VNIAAAVAADKDRRIVVNSFSSSGYSVALPD